jgi:hypothetical protein
MPTLVKERQGKMPISFHCINTPCLDFGKIVQPHHDLKAADSTHPARNQVSDDA